jgi:hypothetical protein
VGNVKNSDFNRYAYTGVACDVCGFSDEWLGTLTGSRLIAVARISGWSLGKRALCPNCRKTRRDKEQ